MGNGEKTKKQWFLWGIVLCITVLVSCGIEDYPFLYPVPQGNITQDGDFQATINLPNLGIDYAPYFTIYYRIYISGRQPSGGRIDEGSMNDVNPTLSSDYAYFLPYTTAGTTTISTSVGTLFNNRNYKTLALEEANIERDILSQNAGGKTIILDFPQTSGTTIPVLVIDNTRYNLQRSTGNGLFSPKPDNRYFLNHPELNASANVSSTINADVVNIDPPNSAGTRYTYVALYIVVTGIDNNFSPVYSAPAFIGILRLPEGQY